MNLITVNHSSYPRIGDDPGQQVLRRTIADWEKGTKSDADLRAAEERMTELALAEQIEAGLDVVTDGQIRWYDSISHLAGKLSGVRINGLLRFFDTNTYFRQPVVKAPVERTRPLALDDFLFAKTKSSRPVKAVLTGPVTLARHSIEENGGAGGFEKLVEGYTASLTAEVSALAQAGAILIQIDEPALLKKPENLAIAGRCLAVLAAAKGKAEILLALYFGNAAPLYDQLQKLPVDSLGLDFTYSARLGEVISTSGSAKTLALGLVDGRNTKLEDTRAVALQIEAIAKRLDATRLYLTSSCGLEYLPRDRAQLKLRRLAAIKNEFLGGQA